jgi:hypothetical protein
VTLTPNEIDAGVNTIVCKLSGTKDAPLGLHTLQIRAEISGANAAGAATLVRTQPLIDRQIVNVDLIPHALREDQRRLPPSLTDRFALQVTPPSFFTFEMPEPLVTLGRYQHADFPILATRTQGFDGPLSFSAKGGQIAPKEEGRTRVYVEFTRDKGTIHSKILTNLAKHRVDVTAVGINAKDGRRVTLMRAFDLDIRAAYVIKADPPLLKIEPGATGKLRLSAERMKTFDADVTLQITPVLGLDLPTTITIPRGQSFVEVPIAIPPDRTPTRYNVPWTASAEVNGFEEDQRGRFEVEVVKGAAAKK